METTFANRVKQFREYKGLAQAAFAERCDLTQGNVSQMEAGTEPKQSNVSKLLLGFPDLNPDWLLTGDGPMLRDGKELTRRAAPASDVEPAAPWLSHTTMTPEQIGAVLIENATLRARAEAAEKEAARYWSFVERQAGKKTEGNLTAASEPVATYDVTPRTPIGPQPGAKKTEAVVREMWPSESEQVTPSYATAQKAS